MANFITLKNQPMKLLSTPLGTFLKTFVSTVLTLWLIELSNGTTLFSLDYEMIEKLATGGVVSALPVIINWLNPNYTQYGVK